MREIKFRVWNGNKMVYQDQFKRFCFSNSAYVELWDEPCGDISDGFSLSDKELMQYTGLKDQNGKEIYEGDILSYGTYKHVIVFSELEDADGALLMGYGLAAPNTKSCEVIGNIYENPELLND